MKHVAIKEWYLRPDELCHFQRNHLEIEATFDVFDLNALDMVNAFQSRTNHNKMLNFFKDLFRDQVRVVHIVRNGPATILFWDDGVKTVVKLQSGDTNDPEKAIMAGMLKRLYPNWQDVLRKKNAIEVQQ